MHAKADSIAKRQADDTPLSIAMRRGVSFPDWSAAQSDIAQHVVRSLTYAFDVRTRWQGYSSEEDLVHVALLDLYASLGRAPALAELAKAVRMTVVEVRGLLLALRQRDMVVLDGDGRITGAYPFTENETGHRVLLGGKSPNAMCAIDALGAGAMYGCNSSIESACRHCDVPIRIEITGDGTSIAGTTPADTFLLVGSYYEDCAATSLCTVIAFFCSDDHLESWRTARDAEEMVRLSLDDGLQVGRAIFAPFLLGTHNRGQARADEGNN